MLVLSFVDFQFKYLETSHDAILLKWFSVIVLQAWMKHASCLIFIKFKWKLIYTEEYSNPCRYMLSFRYPALHGTSNTNNWKICFLFTLLLLCFIFVYKMAHLTQSFLISYSWMIGKKFKGIKCHMFLGFFWKSGVKLVFENSDKNTQVACCTVQINKSSSRKHTLCILVVEQSSK